MERYVCIHGHFYQPPRENPWLEAIEVQDSAYPYHDWNERVTVECYAPNRASRILDPEGRIDRIVNNYARMSFNFGPTLLAWMEHVDPETYQGILAADKASQEAFGGHGSALAQPYNHMILPLANRRDKQTQVIWGLRDFKYRFKRSPEGMWLPETAVDLDTLGVLAKQGIKFTVLAPAQARRTRLLTGRSWRDTSGGRIDPKAPYQVRLSTGRTMALFFYDGPISHDIAFGGLLKRGEDLVGRLFGAFSDAAGPAQLVHTATDGETYGHHQRFGDMALAFALHQIEQQDAVRLTNYGQFLEKFPPAQAVQIFENSSWSCAHGVERWRSDCGCNSGGHAGWNQAWRAPLRQALDTLRDDLAPRFEEKAGALLKDPWVARDAYIDVVLNRSRQSTDAFFAEHARRKLDEAETVTALKLLELQRHAMLMYTSCGWFFDEISGIETVQVLQYAGRVVQLAQQLLGNDPEPCFLEQLAQARSNIPEYGDGRAVYQRFVKPSVVDLPKVCAHYAVSSLFEDYGEKSKIYCYSVAREEYKLLESGKVRLALGKVKVCSDITYEAEDLTVGIVHLGDHNFAGGVRGFQGDEAYHQLVQEVSDGFARADIPELIRVTDKNFGQGSYSLKFLFRDQQRKIIKSILASTSAEAEALYRRFYQDHGTLMKFLTDMGFTPPKPLKMAAEFLLNADLLRALKSAQLEPVQIEALLAEAKKASADLDASGLEYAARCSLIRLAKEFRAAPEDLARMQNLRTAMQAVRSLPFEVSLWEPQNLFYDVLEHVYPDLAHRLRDGEENARIWCTHFQALGEGLRVRVPVADGKPA